MHVKRRICEKIAKFASTKSEQNRDQALHALNGEL